MSIFRFVNPLMLTRQCLPLLTLALLVYLCVVRFYFMTQRFGLPTCIIRPITDVHERLGIPSRDSRTEGFSI